MKALHDLRAHVSESAQAIRDSDQSDSNKYLACFKLLDQVIGKLGAELLIDYEYAIADACERNLLVCRAVKPDAHPGPVPGALRWHVFKYSRKYASFKTSSEDLLRLEFCDRCVGVATCKEYDTNTCDECSKYGNGRDLEQADAVRYVRHLHGIEVCK